MTQALRKSLFLTAALALASSPALAQAVDGEAFVARLQETLSAAGGTMTHGAVRTEGQNVIVDGVTVSSGEDAVPVGEVRFENVTRSDAEGWRAERGSVSDIEHTEGETVTRAQGIAFADLVILPEGAGLAAGIPGNELRVNEATLSSLTISQGGTQTFTLSDLEARGRFGESDAPNTFEISVGSFSLAPQLGETPDSEDGLRSLGYEALNGTLSAEGLWDARSGELTLSPLRIDVNDAANMTFAYSISGYTPAFIQQLAALQTQMAANPEGQSGASMAMLGLLSQLTLNSAELRLEDRSLTNRVLDHSAEQRSVSRAEVIEQILSTLPGILGYLNNPAFQSQVTEAVGSFLRDPRSISATIAPAQPIPAMQIVTAAVGAPQTLPALLDLKITSND